jgi:hypothetical protein
MSYRVVPLIAVLSVLPPDEADTIQARAIDGFVAELPRTLIGGAAVPWLLTVADRNRSPGQVAICCIVAGKALAEASIARKAL